MGKGLAIMGIIASIAAMLSILVFVGAAVFLVLPVIVTGSIILVLQKNVAGAIAGLLVLALAVVASLGLMGSVTTEDGGETDFGFSEEAGRLLAIAGCLAIPLAAIVVRWSRIEPQALAFVGIVCAAVAFLLAAVRPDQLVNQDDLLTLATGLLPLGTIVSMVGLWRGGDREAHDQAMG